MWKLLPVLEFLKIWKKMITPRAIADEEDVGKNFKLVLLQCCFCNKRCVNTMLPCWQSTPWSFLCCITLNVFKQVHSPAIQPVVNSCLLKLQKDEFSLPKRIFRLEHYVSEPPVQIMWINILVPAWLWDERSWLQKLLLIFIPQCDRITAIGDFHLILKICQSFFTCAPLCIDLMRMCCNVCLHMSTVVLEDH